MSVYEHTYISMREDMNMSYIIYYI